MLMEMAADVIVTAQRAKGAAAPAVIARAENLGDLKLYTIPVPVTVAARSQKQVAFLVKERVMGELVYRAQVDWGGPEAPQMLFRFRNRQRDGAGDPLPAGKAVLYQDARFGRMFVGEANLPDKAVDEEVELTFGEAGNVTLEAIERSEPNGRGSYFAVTIRNANPFPVRFEMDFPKRGERKFAGFPGKMIDKPAKRVWTATIPANNTAQLSYRATDRQ
jgi:hypothetical protein